MPKTLVVRTCAVGDFVLNLPALIAAQRMKPGLRFTLIVNKSTLQLAREFVATDSIGSIDAQPWSRLFYEPIPGLEFDDAIVWMKDPIVAENLRSSGIPKVIRADPFPEFGHAVDHLLRTLNAVRPDLPDRWDPSSNEIVVHAGSGSAKKNWPYFDGLMQRLKTSVSLPQNLSLPEVLNYVRRRRAFIGNDSGI